MHRVQKLNNNNDNLCVHVQRVNDKMYILDVNSIVKFHAFSYFGMKKYSISVSFNCVVDIQEKTSAGVQQCARVCSGRCGLPQGSSLFQHLVSLPVVALTEQE